MHVHSKILSLDGIRKFLESAFEHQETGGFPDLDCAKIIPPWCPNACPSKPLYIPSLHFVGENSLNPKTYLDPPMWYVFGSPNKNPNPKTTPSSKRNYIGGPRYSLYI